MLKKNKETIKYHHKLLLADMIYINYIDSTFKYNNIEIEDIYKLVTNGTKYNGLEQLEIIKETKILIKYNRYFNKK